MRILYSIVFLLFVSALTVNGQSREEYDLPFDNKSIHIFPNPAVDFVHVRLEKVPAKTVSLSVHNIIGNEMKVEVEVVDEHELRIRVKELDAGYYLVALKDEDDHYRGTYKFLKR